MAATLSAEEAADRLGVKRATLYAYVSRGVLRSRREPGARRSRFDAAEVEALARRGRPRRASRPPALDFVIETSVTTIDDLDVRYRGRSALALARTATFEEVAQWLWTGTDEKEASPWEPAPIEVPELADARDRIRVAVALAAAQDPLRADLEPVAVLRHARTLVATMVAAVPAADGARAARLHLPGRERPLRATIAGRLWGRLSSARPTPPLVAALNAALVLLADHELAVSTLAARVAASARADPYAVVLAGLGPLAGPLHGGASRWAVELLDLAAAIGPEPAIARMMEAQRFLPGFGHRVYGAGDPRAKVLLGLLRDAAPADRGLVLADQLVAAVRHRADVEANIDFALAVLTRVARLPAEAGEAIFTIARTAGWMAHALEEYGEEPLRFRARASAPRPALSVPPAVP